MSYGKLNIWFRNLDCSLVEKCWRTDLVIKSCCGDYLVDMDPMFLEQLKDKYPNYDISVHKYLGEKRIKIQPKPGQYLTHIDLKVPPGCYVVWTRVCYGRNEETNKVMAIVDCGKEACVNLLLNKVNRCIREVLYPFAVQAIDKGLPEREVKIAVKALMEAGEIQKKEFVEENEQRIEELQDQKEAFEYLKPTKLILEMAKSLKMEKC
jgi:hypothetical protein